MASIHPSIETGVAEWKRLRATLAETPAGDVATSDAIKRELGRVEDALGPSEYLALEEIYRTECIAEGTAYTPWTPAENKAPPAVRTARLLGATLAIVALIVCIMGTIGMAERGTSAARIAFIVGACGVFIFSIKQIWRTTVRRGGN